ncbi:MAG: FCD domain-containing protein [Oscillospiraceae bacterium]|nr:FCD domain-containing protein [Oscillospiraceae bacterium]
MLTPEIIERLRQLTYKREGDEKEKWNAWTENNRFHLALTECAGNAQVTSVLKRALSTCTRAYAQVYELSRAAVIFGDKENNHQKIVKALENHEFYAAHDFLKNDIMIMERQLLSSGSED